jgi:hypothetical protein
MDKEKEIDHHIAGYNPATDSEIKGLSHQDIEVSTTAKWIINSGASTHMTPDKVLFQYIWPIRNEIRVGNSMGFPINGIGTVSLFIVLKDGSIKNIMLNDYLYVPGLMKSFFSWSKLKSINQHYLEDHGDMLVRKIVNDEVILRQENAHVLTY